MLGFLLVFFMAQAYAQMPGQPFAPYTIDEATHNGIMNYLNNMPVARMQTDPLVQLFGRLETDEQRNALVKKDKAPEPKK